MVTTAGTVTVVGIGEDGWAGLVPASQQALREARVVVGSPRQLTLLPDLPVRTEPLAFDRLDEQVALPGVCFLASGDPMLHGLGATLARRGVVLRVLPAVSSVQLACARLAWPAADVRVVSLVTDPPESLLAHLAAGARLLVLVRDGATAPALARLLAEHGWGASPVTVLSRLGGPAETVAGTTAAELAETDPLTVLAVECLGWAPARVPGLPDDAYDSDGQLTKREVRAVTLAALAPRPGQLLWDVGAGAGSVAIEWVRAGGRALAVERDPARAERITRNALTLGAPGVSVVRGGAPAALTGLATPDAVFVGGGVTVPGLLDACWAALHPGGRLVANAVTLESEALLHAWHRAHGGTLTRLEVSRAGAVGGFTAWRPAMPVTQLTLVRGGGDHLAAAQLQPRGQVESGQGAGA